MPTKNRKEWVIARVRKEFRAQRGASNPDHLAFLLAYAETSLDNLKAQVRRRASSPTLQRIPPLGHLPSSSSHVSSLSRIRGAAGCAARALDGAQERRHRDLTLALTCTVPFPPSLCFSPQSSHALIVALICHTYVLTSAGWSARSLTRPRRAATRSRRQATRCVTSSRLPPPWMAARTEVFPRTQELSVWC